VSASEDIEPRNVVNVARVPRGSESLTRDGREQIIVRQDIPSQRHSETRLRAVWETVCSLAAEKTGRASSAGIS
jgi:hypothetical protein